MELYYKRVESVRKGRVHPARTQTVVIFLPDIRSCLPTRFEWDELTTKYKKRLDMKLQSNHSVDREIIDRVEKKSHSTSLGQDESETANNVGGGSGGGGDVGDGDIEMADGSSTKLEKSMATDGENQSKAADSSEATKTTGGESGGQVAATSSAISKALHKNIISINITLYFFRCSVFSLFQISCPRFIETKRN